MKKQNHLKRTVLILVAIVVSVINFYPSIGWYGLLTPEEREIRSEQFKEEDRVRAGLDSSFFQEVKWGVQRWAQFDNNWLITPGLDLQGGVHLVVGFDMTEEAEERELSIAEVQGLVLQRIRMRIELFESKEPIIQKLGTNQVQIQLPGEKDVERAKKIIFGAGVMNFHIGTDLNDPQDQFDTFDVIKMIDVATGNGLIPFLEKPVPADFESRSLRVSQKNYSLVSELLKTEEAKNAIPESRIIRFSPTPPDYDAEADYELYVLNADVGVSGELITGASAGPNPESPGTWMILFDFNAEGGQIFAELTDTNTGRALAIVLDEKVMSAPNIREKISGGAGNITGRFSSEEAQDIAIALNSGSMPVPLREDYAGIVGSSIGGASATKGINSSFIGLVLVMAFMLVYYRTAGLIANFSLAINAVLIMGAFSYFGITLTLPGIAGMILTIGMAVDANVLIFERIREEARLGKSLQHCVEGGYARASSAIWDANVTTLIAAVVLTQFGTGPIQGFAIALSIGVCTSVFSALVVSRAFLEFIAERQMLKEFTMSSFLKDEPSFNFLGKRKMAAVASIIVILIGAGWFVKRGQENFGVDFTNGTNMQVSIKSSSTISVHDVREVLFASALKSPVVQEASDDTGTDSNSFLIRIADDSVESGSTDNSESEVPGSDTVISVSEEVQKVLMVLSDVTSDVLAEKVEILEAQTVGPSVGKQLRRDAINAIFFALVFIIAYLWVRFEGKYAVGAVVALVHDVLIVMGVMSLCGREISIPVVAALLTIIGYSLNDTIVVFDRVREDIGLNKSRGLKFIDMINLSLNRTLSRTLLTSITTFFVVAVLYVFGGPAINDFAFALIIGIVVGTYSSLFVATPTVYYLNNWIEKRALDADAK